MTTRIDAGPRRCGKTYRAIEALRADPNLVLVVMTAREAIRVGKLAPDVAKRVAFADRSAVRAAASHVGGPVGLVVDEANAILSSILGAPVVAVTISTIDAWEGP